MFARCASTLALAAALGSGAGCDGSGFERASGVSGAPAGAGNGAAADGGSATEPPPGGASGRGGGAASGGEIEAGAGAAGVAPEDPGPSELALVEATIDELRRAIATRLVTPAELTQMYLARIAAFDDAGPELNAFLQLNENAAAEATALGTRCEDMGAPPLCGIPIVLKDNVDTADIPTTAGSLALAGSLPQADAFLTRRLRDAGAVIIGKATLSEFANFLATNMPSGYSSLGGFGFNPYDPRPQPGGDGRPVLTPGGSSSGSAIAVSANLAAAGIGTETSGSILSPASSNGVVGIKPSIGLVSSAGIIPISADQDTAGPIARSVADAALLLGVIAGVDPADVATNACLEAGRCQTDYTQFLDPGALENARIAVPPFPGARSSIMEGAIAALEQRGAIVELVDALPGQRGACASAPPGNNCSTVLIYGFKRDLNAYLASTPRAPVRSLADVIAFNSSTPGALVYGQQLALAAEALDTAPGSSDTARYLADLELGRESARAALDAVYAGEDGVLGSEDDIDALLFSENAGAATPASAGYPSITVPGGFIEPNGAVENAFPSGVTFSGPAFSEPGLIALAYAFEQATRHRQPPPSTPALATDLVKR